MPDAIRKTLGCHDAVKTIAEKYAGVSNCLYLGRQYLYPVALEGALKLKEISYIHAEGYAAAEMKHGPIALVDEHLPIVFVAPKDEVYQKVLSNLAEVHARGGDITAVTTEGDDELGALVQHRLSVPATTSLLSPVLTVIPLQLLAYHIAVARGCDVDRPRNLAKSVTVE